MKVIKSLEQLHALASSPGTPILLYKFLDHYLHDLTQRLGKSPWAIEPEGDGDTFVVLEPGDLSSVLQDESILSDGSSILDVDTEAVMLYHIIGPAKDHLDLYHTIILQNNESVLNIFSIALTLDDEMEASLAEQSSYVPEMEVTIC